MKFLHRPLKFFILVLLLTISTVIHAQETCTALLDSVLNTVADNCNGPGRNEACYGNLQLTASGRSTDFDFDDVSDVEAVSNFGTLSTNPANSDDGTWGIAVMNLQANLPGTLPGQNVTMLIVGNTEIENQVIDQTTFSGTINASARVRSAPYDGQVLASFETGTTVTIFGRNESSDWVRVVDERGTYGWIATFLVDFTDDISILSVVEFDALLPLAPMQAFTLTTGIGQSTCSDIPEGIIVQTPDDAVSVTFTVNGISVNMASTLHLSVIENDNQKSLLVQTLEGTGIVSNDFGVSVAPAGTRITVPLDEIGTEPTNAPSEPLSIPQTELDNLNTIVQSGGYARLLNEATTPPETVTEELTDSEIEDLTSPPDDTDGMSGTWEWVFFVRYTGGSTCIVEGQEPGRYGGLIEVVFDGDTMSYTNSRGFTSTYTRSGDNTYGTFDTATFAFTVESPFYMSYERSPVNVYTVGGTDCTQSISGYAIRR